ncbi:MAG: aldo/keto reductase [Halobacteriaceae archaeon]
MPGAELPSVGLGTWQNTDPEVCTRSVEYALELGYRHVDTAQFYRNEEHVGEGLARADVDRDGVVVATKVHPEGPYESVDDVVGAARGCCERLGVDYLDLLYVHWPVGNYDPETVMPQFDDAVEEGLIRHVGVSNFEPEIVEAAQAELEAPVFANQVEMHPLLQQERLHEHALEHDYWLVAYSPLARGEVFEVPELQEIAEKHGVSEAQVSLAWLTAKENVVAVPKASTREHLRDNWAARDLELDAEDREKIAGIDRTERLLDRAGAPWN